MRAGTTRAIGIGAIIALAGPGEAAEASAQRTSEPAADRTAIVRLVAAVRRADYEGDRAGLRRLHHELAVAADGALGARIAYWRGFALWRRAFNGFNDGVERGDLERDLVEAVREFDLAAAHDSTLVDARIGSISCLQSLAFLYQHDAAKVATVVSRFVALLRKAQTAAPDFIRLARSGPGGRPRVSSSRRVLEGSGSLRGVRTRTRPITSLPLGSSCGIHRTGCVWASTSISLERPRPFRSRHPSRPSSRSSLRSTRVSFECSRPVFRTTPWRISSSVRASEAGPPRSSRSTALSPTVLIGPEEDGDVEGNQCRDSCAAGLARCRHPQPVRKRGEPLTILRLCSQQVVSRTVPFLAPAATPGRASSTFRTSQRVEGGPRRWDWNVQ